MNKNCDLVALSPVAAVFVVLWLLAGRLSALGVLGSEPSQPPAPADRAPPQAALSAAAAAPPPVTVPPADGDALSEAARMTFFGRLG